MTDLLDAAECRRRALMFARYSAIFALPEAHARFARIATNWMALAFELEQRGSDYASEKRQRVG